MSGTLQFELVTPEKLAASEAVAMVEVPGEMGDFGVLPGHAPFFSMIRPGAVAVHSEGGALTRYFVPAGYAEVNPEGCTLLVEHARALEGISKAQAEEELLAAKKRLELAKKEHEKAACERAVIVAQALVEAV